MNSSDPQTSAARLKKISSLRPTLAIVLGSGFHHALAELRMDRKIGFAKIPGFPELTVSGHAGELFFGHLGRTPVLVLSGRAHFYEGRSMEAVTFAVRALAAFGITDLLLTNAAGGINKTFRAGDFMVVTDHINFMGTNPLRPGDSDASSPSVPAMGTSQAPLTRFVDLTEAYDKNLRELLFKAGMVSKLRLRRGVYIAVSGPSYETAADPWLETPLPQVLRIVELVAREHLAKPRLGMCPARTSSRSATCDACKSWRAWPNDPISGIGLHPS